MSIVAVQNVTIFGLVEDKERILEELQELGCLHLRSLKPEEAPRPDGERLSEDTREAWRFLNDCPNKRIQLGRLQHYDPAKMQTRALEIKRDLESLEDEQDFLRARIEDVRGWGDFKFSPDEKMAGHHLWFYVVPNYLMPKVEETGLTWEAVNRTDRFTYLIVISPAEPKNMPVERVHIGARSLTELETRLEEVELEIDELQVEREGLTRGLKIYERNMGQLEDRAGRAEAGRLTLENRPLFALQAWAPREKAEVLQDFARENGLAIQIEEPAPEDAPPTLLENPERWEIGESLVRFYMTPGYRLWDPSMIVLFSFTLFFAMIISDAGYGLLMVAGIFLMRRKLRKSRATLRLRTLCCLLTGATIVWGILVGSYFGLSPAEGSFLAKLKVMDLNDMGFMMKLSVLIGASHIVLANFMDFWRRRTSPAALAPIGWSVVIISGVVLWLNSTAPEEAETIKTLGTAGLVLGFAAVAVFSAVGAEGGIFKRLFAGAMSLTRVTSAFGDVMSYLRLFALGLASASLAIAFNGLARDVYESVSGIGFLFAIIIILIGHTINLALCIVSGFVHGLRLNLIEFFSWSIPEEGRPFRAFRKKEIAG